MGRGHEVRGRALLTAFAQHSGATFVCSPPDQPAGLDGVCVRNGQVCAVVEGKSRSGYPLAKIRALGASLLISASKLTGLARGAVALGVAGFVVAEFADGYRWYWRVCNPDGSPCFPWDERRSITQADSIGTGPIERTNAYLPLDNGVCWYAPEELALDSTVSRV